MVLPRKARFELLKLPFASADGVMSARAIVCSGIFVDSANRACSAASFADSRLRSGGGEGRETRGGNDVHWSPTMSCANSGAMAAAEDWHRMDWKRVCRTGREEAPDRA